ncbi:MAG: transcription antitermination factor NusB [Actinomycetia bacterium]|nr:transcription antitermination factor NusB [Actinomycetes bacterium]
MAFQLLFASEFNDLPANRLFDEGYYCADIGLPCDFSRQLFVGTHEHLAEIDALIEATAIDWQISRLPLADKAILRLAIFEMLFMDDIPISVSIDEAVELAKAFGGSEKSPVFVNGVLGRIAAILAGDATVPPIDDSAAAAVLGLGEMAGSPSVENPATSPTRVVASPS